MDYKLKNPEIIISNKMKVFIDDIAKSFKEKYSKSITITSGKRSPEKQAEAMYDNFIKENGTAYQRKKYRNTRLFDQIGEAFKLYRKKGRSFTTNKMTEIIKKQILRNEYISFHLIESAVDIRTYDLNGEQIEYLILLIKKYHYCISYQDKRNNKNPHIHLQLSVEILSC